MTTRTEAKQELDRLSQLHLEQESIDSGIAKYHKGIQEAQKSRRGSDTTYGIDMIRFYVKGVSEQITKSVQANVGRAGRTSIAFEYLKDIDPDTAAYITCKYIFNNVSPKLVKESGLSYMCTGLAKKVEDNARFEAFDTQSRAQAKAEGTQGGYFKATMELIKNRKIVDYNKKKATLLNAADRAENYGNVIQKWNAWSVKHQAHIGMVLIDCFIKGTSDYNTDGIRIEGTGLIEKYMRQGDKRNVYYVLCPTDKFHDWVKGNVSIMQYMQPDFQPMQTEPLEWLSSTDGGYFSKGLQDMKPLVKVYNKDYLGTYTPENSQLLFKACNTLQSTEYEINPFVLGQALQEIKSPNGVGMAGQKDIIPPCPLSMPAGLTRAEEKEYKKSQKGKLSPEDKEAFALWAEFKRKAELSNQAKTSKLLQLSKTIGLAQKFQFKEKLHFVYTVDFRGRMYASCTDLSPQGTDISKGLLRFKNSKPLGKNGLRHLYYHAAGCYGVDKCTLQDRYDWVVTNLATIQNIPLDPDGTRDFWSNADKPYMFLAVAEEIADIQTHIAMGNPVDTFESKIICFQDGSCNGLQHFSAMLLDPVGGKAVNLVDSDIPTDIYGLTSSLVIQYLNKTIDSHLVYNGKEWVEATEQDIRIARALLEFGIDRKTTKKSTMTIPYGGTKIGCRDQVTDWYNEELEKRIMHDPHYQSPLEHLLILNDEDEVLQNKGENYALKQLHHLVWLALDETVVAARTAMKLLQQICSAVQKVNPNGNPIIWTTPAGYKVYQDIKDQEQMRIKTMIDGSINLFLKRDLKSINKRKMRTSIAPNFVHSLDASHLMLVLNALKNMGINDIATVHDSYGTHAGACDLIHYAIRKTFIDMYSGDILLKFWQEQAQAYPDAVQYFPDVTLIKKGDLVLKGVLRSRHFFR